MNNKLFGIDICNCDEDVREEETINGIVFDANCKGVIALAESEELEDVHD